MSAELGTDFAELPVPNRTLTRQKHPGKIGGILEKGCLEILHSFHIFRIFPNFPGHLGHGIHVVGGIYALKRKQNKVMFVYRFIF